MEFILYLVIGYIIIHTYTILEYYKKEFLILVTVSALPLFLI